MKALIVIWSTISPLSGCSVATIIVRKSVCSLFVFAYRGERFLESISICQLAAHMVCFLCIGGDAERTLYERLDRSGCYDQEGDNVLKNVSADTTSIGGNSIDKASSYFSSISS